MADDHARWLADRLVEWEREGLLGADAARALRERYPVAPRRNLATLVIGSLGGLCIGAGLIAVVASNWDDLPRWARLTVAFAPLAVTQAISARLLLRGSTTQPWMLEAAGLAQAAAVAAALVLVSQIYHLPGKWNEFALLWCVLVLPLAWVMRARGVAIAYLLGAAAWALGRAGDFGMNGVDTGAFDPRIVYPLLLAGLLPLWPGPTLRERPPESVGRVLAATALAGLIAVAAFDMHRAGQSDDTFAWPAMLTAAAVMLVPPGLAGGGDGLPGPAARTQWQAPQVGFGGIVLVAMALVATYRSPAPAFVASVGPALVRPWTRAVVVALVVLAVVALRQGRLAVLAVAALALVPPLLTLSPQGGGAGPAVSWEPANGFWLAVLAVAVVLIALEFGGREGEARLGGALVTILVMLRMADQDVPLVSKGIAFILLGCGFLAFNMLVSRRRAGGVAARPA